jgi:hypothetical protein
MTQLVDSTTLARRGNPDGGPTRADTWRCTVTLNGENMGVFDKKTGGKVTSSVTQYLPGGMAPQISLGGTKTTENVTLERLYRLQRDHKKIQKWINAVGKGNLILHQQPLDTDGNAYGTPVVYKGTLMSVSPPDVDSTSTAAAMLSIEVVIDSQPHVG